MRQSNKSQGNEYNFMLSKKVKLTLQAPSFLFGGAGAEFRGVPVLFEEHDFIGFINSPPSPPRHLRSLVHLSSRTFNSNI